MGDFNGDGKLDLAVTTRPFGSGPGFVNVLFGNGDGTFQAPVNYRLAMHPDSVTVADFENDGRPDLVVSASAAPAGARSGPRYC